MAASVLPRLFRRCAAIVAAALVGLGLCLVQPSPAFAAGGGYVRLAHLVPDTIACDMYLQLHSVSGDVVTYLPSVKYGTVSDYVMVPAGTYAVAMRGPGSDPKSPPVLSTSLTVADGHAYTVGRMGSPSSAEARVIEDDRTLPASDEAKLRVVQAAQRTLDVTLDGGPVIARNLAFTTATGYQGVAPGTRTLNVQPAGGKPIAVPASMTAGSIYSLLVLQDGDGNIRVELLVDAKRDGTVPRGGVETGAGGTAQPQPDRTAGIVAVIVLGLFCVVVGTGVLAARPAALRVRRTTGSRR